MKLGIVLIILGTIFITGNLIDFQPYPLWALIVRLLISASIVTGGILRLYYKRLKEEVK